MTSRIIISALTLSCFLPFIQASEWKDTAKQRINQGDFSHAREILLNLPDSIKHTHFFEIDSLNAMMARISRDFSLSRKDGINAIHKKAPNATEEQINEWIKNKYIETLNIDGEELWFRKAVRNLYLLNPELKSYKEENIDDVIEMIQTNLKATPDDNGIRNWNLAKIRCTFTVNADSVPAGEKIRVWLPLPVETARQRNVKITSSSSHVIQSKSSVHNTAYMEQIAVKGKPSIFTLEVQYEVAAQYFDKKDILKNLKPYDTKSENYIKYTTSQAPHIILSDDMRTLALKIIGKENNPVKQAALIYDWISDNYPWAGARDYSTIPNIPEYVIENRHGDCGQVSLLYITLTRSLGIPSRWESGLMIHPWDLNYHDWCETYFEGTGWVPTDISFGRTKKPLKRKYFLTGTDQYRYASNTGFSGVMSPPKQFVRTETVDCQAGEAEWNGGNIEANAWKSDYELLEFSKLNK